MVVFSNIIRFFNKEKQHNYKTKCLLYKNTIINTWFCYITNLTTINQNTKNLSAQYKKRTTPCVFYYSFPYHLLIVVLIFQTLDEGVYSFEIVLVEIVDCDSALLVVADKFDFGCKDAFHISDKLFEFE